MRAVLLVLFIVNVLNGYCNTCVDSVRKDYVGKIAKTTYPNGTVVDSYPNGLVVIVSRDGTTTIHDPIAAAKKIRFFVLALLLMIIIYGASIYIYIKYMDKEKKLIFPVNNGRMISLWLCIGIFPVLCKEVLNSLYGWGYFRWAGFLLDRSEFGRDFLFMMVGAVFLVFSIRLIRRYWPVA